LRFFLCPRKSRGDLVSPLRDQSATDTDPPNTRLSYRPLNNTRTEKTPFSTKPTLSDPSPSHPPHLPHVKSWVMVMPTVLTDRFASLDYPDFTNNHVFLKKALNNGFFEHNDQHGVPTPGPTAKELIGDAFRDRVENIDHEFCDPGEEDTFFVADLGEVYRQHLRWKLNLPRVKPFYGM